MEPLIEFIRNFDNYVREHYLTLFIIFTCWFLINTFIGEKLPGLKTWMSNLLSITLGLYIVLWVLSMLLLERYESLMTHAVVFFLPIIYLVGSWAYRRYDAWIDKVADKK